MATVHLICGFLGAGKTTFAKALAEQKSAIRFSIDELYLRLFADGPTYDVDAKALERLRDALNDIWPQLAQAGLDVVLDCGFWQRAHRDEVRQRAASIGAATCLYWLRCPDEVGVARCLQRNGAPGAFLFSAEGFHWLKARFEPPDPSELVQVLDT